MNGHLLIVALFLAFLDLCLGDEVIPPVGVAGIRGEFINKESYLEWLKTPQLDEVLPLPQDARSPLLIILDDEYVGGAWFRVYLSHVCTKAIESGQALLLVLEMADWIEAPEVQKQISASLAIQRLFPDQKGLLPPSIIMASQKEKAELAEKFRGLGRTKFSTAK
jgi:hypothetical protein